MLIIELRELHCVREGSILDAIRWSLVALSKNYDCSAAFLLHLGMKDGAELATEVLLIELTKVEAS
jgi:hypothetical protein